jgi:hypothetical protein
VYRNVAAATTGMLMYTFMRASECGVNWSGRVYRNVAAATTGMLMNSFMRASECGVDRWLCECARGECVFGRSRRSVISELGETAQLKLSDCMGKPVQRSVREHDHTLRQTQRALAELNACAPATKSLLSTWADHADMGVRVDRAVQHDAEASSL